MSLYTGFNCTVSTLGEKRNAKSQTSHQTIATPDLFSKINLLLTPKKERKRKHQFQTKSQRNVYTELLFI